MEFIKTVKELQKDTFSPILIPAFTTGIINGIIVVIVMVSFAAMIFSGEISQMATRAAGMTLFGSFIMGLLVLVYSGIKTNVSIPQDAPAATLTGAIPSVAALLSISQETAFITMAAILALTSLTTAVIFICIGYFRLANLFRFIPYPVIGGFLAGSGYLLATGGLSVMSDISFGFSTFQQFMVSDTIVKWVPGVIFGLGLFLIMLKTSHHLILPGALAAATVIYYLCFWIFNIPLTEAQSGGHLVSGIPENGLWPVFKISSIQLVEWTVIINNIPLIITTSLVTVICMLLNSSGIEMSLEDELDLNREFVVSGWANAVGGLSGSSPGGVALSLTTLGIRTGANSRLCGFFTITIIGFVLFIGGDLLGYFPKPLLGGLLFLLGLFFLWEWVVCSYHSIPRTDYLLIITIMVVIILFGFLKGVLAGIGFTIIIFVIRFSAVPVIIKRDTLKDQRSLKKRSIPEEKILDNEGNKCKIYQLGGYLFFGSSTTLVESIKNEIDDVTDFLIIDFKHVTGIDISSLNNFSRLHQSLANRTKAIVFSNCSETFQEKLNSSLGETDNISFFKTLDHSKEFCEDSILEEKQKINSFESDDEREHIFNDSVDEVMNLLDRMEIFEKLISTLSSLTKQVTSKQGEKLIKFDEITRGTLLICSGNVSVFDNTGLRVQTLQMGDFYFPKAQFVHSPSQFNVVSDSESSYLIISPEIRTQLEKLSPYDALKLDRYMMRGL